jgi:hypothetical protein
MKNKNILITITLLVISISITAQRQNRFWMFGNRTGFDFSTSIPIPIPPNLNSSNIGYCGTATVSDKRGNLLFYSDGFNIYDNLGNIMDNGIIIPSANASQYYYHIDPVLIVPKPGDDCIYYVFTNNNAYGLRYYTVDMRLNGGLGKVLTGGPNTIWNSCGPMSLIKHGNNQAFWLVTLINDAGTYKFKSYLVDALGVNSSSNSFSVTNPFIPHHAIKSSKDGTKLAVISGSNGSSGIQKHIDLFSFDNSTGTISSQIAKYTPSFGVYETFDDFEFSENGNYLYYIKYNRIPNLYSASIEQIDISSLNPISSPQILYIESPVINGFNNMQIDPNYERIFVFSNTDKLSYIENINSNTSVYHSLAAPLHIGRTSYWGTPKIIPELSSITSPSQINYPNAHIPISNYISLSDFNQLDFSMAGTWNINYDYGIQFKDIDNDGDLDMFYSKNALGGPVPCYRENTGSVTTPAFSSIETIIPGILDYQSMNIVDWDRDGFLDLVAMKNNTNLELFFFKFNTGNTGPNFYDPPIQISVTSAASLAFPPTNYLCRFTLSDFDNDGDIDGMLGTREFGHHIIYYENVSNVLSTLTNISAIGISNSMYTYNANSSMSIPSPELYDVDHDGDLDLFVGFGKGLNNVQEYAEIHYFENLGAGSLGPLVVNPFGITNLGVDVLSSVIFNPSFADLEGDGCPSLFLNSIEDHKIRFIFQNCNPCIINPRFDVVLDASTSYNSILVPNIYLTWNDKLDNELGYKIFRKLNFTDSFSNHVSLPPNTTTYTDSNLSINQLYIYKVEAILNAPDSAISNIAAAIIQDTLQVPLAIIDNNLPDIDKLSVFPNPTNGPFCIELTLPEQEIVYEIYDVKGQLMSKKNLKNSKKINDQISFSPGTYFIKVSASDWSHTLKILKIE